MIEQVFCSRMIICILVTNIIVFSEGLLFVGITTINSEKVIVGELSDITTDAQIVIRDEKTVACSVDKPDVLEDPGILQSPSQQQDDMDCHWLIRAPNGYVSISSKHEADVGPASAQHWPTLRVC